MQSEKIHQIIVYLWFGILTFALYAYFFHHAFFTDIFKSTFGSSIYLGYTLFLILGVLRGVTLIPATNLLFLGFLFFPPIPLFFLMVGGILASSLLVYYFSQYLNLDSYFERKYSKEIARIKNLLEKNELLIISFWSGAPFLPTDIICYVAGSLQIDVKKFLLGVAIGESVMIAGYIYFGELLFTRLFF